MKVPSSDEKLRELKKAVREFLHEIEFVPFRAVDCDQELVDNARAKVAKLSGYRSKYG